MDDFDDQDGDAADDASVGAFERGLSRGIGVSAARFFRERRPAPAWAAHLRNRELPKQQWGAGELRWGDKKQLLIDVPAASVAPVGNPEGLVQFVQVTERARVWAIEFNLRWDNPQLAPGAETVSALFGVQTGVGSSTLERFVNLTVNTTLSLNSTVLAVVPASSIYIAAAVSVVPLAGAARQYSVRVAASCAPVFRGDG